MAAERSQRVRVVPGPAERGRRRAGPTGGTRYHVPRMGDPRDPSDLAKHGTTLTVQGSSGVRVQATGVTVESVFVSVPQGPGPVFPAGAPTAAATFASFAQSAGLLASHPKAVAALLLLGGAVVATTSAVFVALLQLSWLLLLVPSVPVLASLAAGGLLLSRAARHGDGAANADLERRLLAFAVAEGGRITVTGAAVALGIPLASVDEALMRLVRSGHVMADNDPSTGAVLYVFPDIQAGLGDRPRRLP